MVVNLVKNSWRFCIDLANRTLQGHFWLWVGIRLFFDVILDFWRKPIRRASRTKMQIFKAGLKFWMLGEFASLKSKHDGGVAEANQQNLLNVIANTVKQSLKSTQNVIVNEVKQSFLHCHCEPKARQTFQLHNNGLPRRYAPRNDDGMASNRLPRRYAPRNDDGAASNGLPRRYAPRNDGGRSMIEMLGVLAIIGVLSVGGIAGYSKAMEKFKLNKAVDDYKMLVFGIVEYKADIEKLQTTAGNIGLADFINAVNLLPKNWKKVDSHQFNDPYGNMLRIAYRNTSSDDEQSRVLMDIYLGGTQTNSEGISVSINFSNELCVALYKDLVFPLHSMFFRAGNYIPYGQTTVMYGDAYCGKGRRCLKDMTVTDFYNACNRCPKNESICTLTFGF